jgi:3-hydroxyisobutyrate/3-hydroxypropionate dehydrogenase
VRGAFLNLSTGLLSISKRESPILFIECSTIDVATSLEVRERVIASNIGSMVDAPASGGPNGANNGTLTFMIGGTDVQFSQVSHIISLMGKG